MKSVERTVDATLAGFCAVFSLPHVGPCPNSGRLPQPDLVIGETFAEWSQRIFGLLVDPNGDADGDGKSNLNEYVAGTDLQDPASKLVPSIVTFKPVPGGGFEFRWESSGSRCGEGRAERHHPSRPHRRDPRPRPQRPRLPPRPP